MEQMIKIKDIILHELNPNLMTKRNIKKLKNLIKNEGNYPPLIVNKKEKGYKLIDGHQRLRVLKELEYDEAKCDVWEVDEKTELVLLSTINKLRGVSITDKKKILYHELSKHLNPAEIRRITPEKKAFFNELYSKIEEKKPLDEKMMARLMFLQKLTRDQYNEVMEYITKNVKPEFHEEAIYYMVKKLKKISSEEKDGKARG
jgi:hypothetical protein